MEYVCHHHKGLFRILEQATEHLRWKVDYPPSQPVGSGFEPHWRPQPAKLPSFGGYSLETLPYLRDFLAHMGPRGVHPADLLEISGCVTLSFLTSNNIQDMYYNYITYIFKYFLVTW